MYASSAVRFQRVVPVLLSGMRYRMTVNVKLQEGYSRDLEGAVRGTRYNTRDPPLDKLVNHYQYFPIVLNLRLMVAFIG